MNRAQPYAPHRWHSPRESASGRSTNQREKGVRPMGFRPLHDRVLVRRVEAEEKTAGGIIIPDTAKEKPQEGEVISVGAGTRDETSKLVELDVKPGDRILFGKWSGTEGRLPDFLLFSWTPAFAGKQVRGLANYGCQRREIQP